MDAKLFVKPAPGRVIPNADQPGTDLPAEGAFVANNRFWRSRLKDGDVVEAPAPKASAPETSSPETNSKKKGA
ncbi:Mu-like prophage FluMu protein (modular protein) [Magnetospirillum sp. XM-1]|uniref:DUF2635 domain-containing protein n=1 Tax=Magnetospirillum sp. XM-1 TaxID=1663591 RepID=UPI00073DDCA1|nr:DUF2635 domain-containing protein [Magnetospirillum sp. XM-1]CUW41140.1 Mu-like prophage FluMu protein (modular protein) [Magnetospirillum sp. XM-1]